MAVLLSCERRPIVESPSQNAAVWFDMRFITGSGQRELFRPATVKSLPQSVIDHFSPGLADRGEDFNTTDVVDGRPRSRVLAAAVSDRHCIVTYWHGGLALTMETAIYELKNADAKLIWRSDSQGGLNFRDLKAMVESGRLRNVLPPSQ
jgi:hypothetical protein